MSHTATVFLEDIVTALEGVDQLTTYWLNKATGEIELMADYLEREEQERLSDLIEFTGDFEKLPGQYEIREYDIMKTFAEQRSGDARRRLIRALNGNKPFRRFKDTLYDLDLQEDYYSFLHQALIKIAKEWCEDFGIPYRYRSEAPTAAGDPPRNPDMA